MNRPVKPSADRIINSGLVSKPRAPQAAPHLIGKLLFFPGWCKKCGLCAAVCPSGALTINGNGHPFLQNPEACRLCSLCWRICPDFAIAKNPETEVTADDDPAAED